MIFTKAPMRISLLGGSSDIPGFFTKHGGEVLSMAIDKYSYVSLRTLPPYFSHSIRLTYSQLENCSNWSEIKHPLIRVALSQNKINNIELHHDSDVPSKSGLGSSSAFGVAMATAINAYKGIYENKRVIANKVIDWERNILQESGGYQDQIISTYGGINHITFYRSGKWEIDPIPFSESTVSEILNRMVLCYLPVERFSANHSPSNHITEPETQSSIHLLRNSVGKGIKLLREKDYDGFGSHLDWAWKVKRKIKNVSNSTINELYNKGIKNGAIGGKLCGAGGGGFMLFWLKQNQKNEFIQAMSNELIVQFKIDMHGAKLIYCNDD